MSSAGNPASGPGDPASAGLSVRGLVVELGGREILHGIDLDLAPVADVVTADMSTRNQPIGQLGRGYGQTASDVTTNAGAVIAGMHAAGVTTSIKHFPGLGDVTANTDEAVAVDTTTRADSDTVGVFAALSGSTDTIMVGSAIYRQIDPDNPALFSSAIVTDLLRDRLGYGGVIVSDDLGAAAALDAYDVAGRGTRFLRAGGDLLDGGVYRFERSGALAEQRIGPVHQLSDVVHGGQQTFRYRRQLL